jgi:quinol monooxygenase YgiN
MFQVHRHKERAGELFIYEQYKDEGALEAHRKTPHFLQYARTELPKFAERISGELYDPL